MTLTDVLNRLNCGWAVCPPRTGEPQMPIGPNGEKRPASVLASALMVARIGTGEQEEEHVDEAMREHGKRVGPNLLVLSGRVSSRNALGRASYNFARLGFVALRAWGAEDGQRFDPRELAARTVGPDLGERTRGVGLRFSEAEILRRRPRQIPCPSTRGRFDQTSAGRRDDRPAVSHRHRW